MQFSKPVTEVIQQRFSCRTYRPLAIDEDTQRRLAQVISAARTGPLGSRARFVLLAARDGDREALRGLGTYGVIRHPAGFVVGAVRESTTMYEDLGYLMEGIVLAATNLGLGTCWLGGTFTHSRFADRIQSQPGEMVPVAVSVGYVAEAPALVDRIIRGRARPNHRLPGERLFFDQRFGHPLSQEASEPYATPLEMVRLAPSASNRQPWRIVRAEGTWHFFVQRTPGYPSWVAAPFVPGDLQRIDLGIAMCHWALSAAELGLPGRWERAAPDIPLPDGAEYIATWVPG